MKLEFIGAEPSAEELTALRLALQRLFLSQRNGTTRMNAWRLAMRYPDAALEDLRRLAFCRWDVL